MIIHTSRAYEWSIKYCLRQQKPTKHNAIALGRNLNTSFSQACKRCAIHHFICKHHTSK